MIHQQIRLLFGVLLFNTILSVCYKRVIGLYASRTGCLNKRHVHASFRFRLRLRLHLKLVSAFLLVLNYYVVVVTLKPIPDLLIVLFLNVIAVHTEANKMF